MIEHYIQLEIVIPDELQELLIAELTDLDFEGFDLHDEYLIAWIAEKDFNDTSREEIERILLHFGKDAYIRSEKKEAPQNWNQIWEASIQPLSVGQFYVKPTWFDGEEDGKISLLIDPKMAFGTGYHETTRVILRLLPDYISSGDNVLDAGTGTGILAIASVKLGAEKAFGFDIDEWSYENSKENIWLNKVQDKVNIALGDDSQIPPSDTYDVVIANINRNILIDMAEKLVHHLKPGGTLILSGLLTGDKSIIEKTKGFDTLDLVKKAQENDWIGLVFKRGTA